MTQRERVPSLLVAGGTITINRGLWERVGSPHRLLVVRSRRMQEIWLVPARGRPNVRFFGEQNPILEAATILHIFRVPIGKYLARVGGDDTIIFDLQLQED